MHAPDLTPREQETLQAVARHLTNLEIAAEFHVSVRTVESHIASLRRKLLAETRRELIQAAANYLGRPVPAPIDSFVGRDDVVVQTQALFQESRWVTLTGPAGVGKTRLALELARLAPSVVVELEHAEPGGVLGAVAAALGVAKTDGRGGFAACCGALAGGQVQLVLDNVDRVRIDAAAAVREFLGQLESLRVITTSRTPLHGPGESIVELAPLPTDEPADPAVVLFLDRARSASRDSDLSDLSAAVAVCRRLEGIPLAIELAAARTRHLSLAELDRLLDDGFAHLGAADARGQRHAALASAFAWTWDLLDGRLQWTLRHLAALPRSFDLDLAAAAVGERVDAEVVELLDSSLLVKVAGGEGTTRFRILGALREFVRGRTDRQVLDLVAHRHAVHHCRLAGRLAAQARTDDRPATRAFAKTVCPEINDALLWAIDRDLPMAAQLAVAVAIGIEQYGPGPGMMQTLIAAASCPDLRATWSAPELEVIGRALTYIRVDLLEVLAERSRELARDGTDADRLAAAQLTGASKVHRDRAEEAVPDLDEAIAIATALDDRWELADALQVKAKALLRIGDLGSGDLLAAFAAARSAFAAAGDSMHVNNTRYMMALVAGRDETLRTQAVAWADECLAYAARHDNETEIGHALLARALAGAASRAEDVTEAVRLFRRVGDLRCLNRGLLAAASLEPRASERVVREALEVGAASGDVDCHRRAAGALATLLWQQGRRSEAAAVVGAAMAALAEEAVLELVPEELAADLTLSMTY